MQVLGVTGGRAWDVHPDGYRFLMITAAGPASVDADLSDFSVNIVLNWFQELRERVPVD